MRCNVGIDPKLLVDQHLIAESVELKMVPGKMRYCKDQGQTMSQPPETFSLGKGHMLFFTDKLSYLNRRLQAVNQEMRARGFKPGYPDYIDLNEFPFYHNGDWAPIDADALILKKRIQQVLLAKPREIRFWRYKRELLYPIELDNLMEQLQCSKTYFV